MIIKNKSYTIRTIILIVTFLSLVSCCTVKKTQTVTETIYKVDTVIRVVKDTITYTNTVKLTDTAYIETEMVKVISYYDTIEKNIVLKLTGKSFNVPVVIDKKVIEKQTIKEPQKKTISLKWFLIGIITGIIVTWLKIKK